MTLAFVFENVSLSHLVSNLAGVLSSYSRQDHGQMPHVRQDRHGEKMRVSEELKLV
jgi:hypothetical protein